LATGAASWSGGGTFNADGTLTWDDDKTSTFYVDTMPSGNTEYGKTSQRSKNLGQSINVENLYYNASTSSEVFMNSDMLSVTIHEVYHSLGHLSTYPLYATALDTGSDGDLD
jgi:hypothetical protein